MPKTQVQSTGITCGAVSTAKIAACGVTEAKIAGNAVTTAKIQDGQVGAADLASSLDLSSKTVTLPPSATAVVDQNVALLGFKMAVNDGLTVFNLVDGVVDEFHDESGADEGEGSNDTYNSRYSDGYELKSYFSIRLQTASKIQGLNYIFGINQIRFEKNGLINDFPSSNKYSIELGIFYNYESSRD